MKKVNVKLIGLVCFLVLFCSMNTFAQKKKTEKESTKKVIIVKKIKDKDGKVRVERIEKEGEEAEKYIKELEIKGTDGQTIDLDIEIDGDEIITSNDKKKRIEIIEIEDIEELSDELKNELRELNIEIEVLEDEIETIVDINNLRGSEMIFAEDNENIETININKNNDKTTIDIKTKDGQKRKFNYKGEMPADVRKELEEMGVKVKKGNYFPRNMRHKNVIRINESIEKRPFLGVEMGNKKSDKGIYIDKVVKESAAEQAGLKSGDIITSIDGNKMAKFGDLVEALSEKKVGDKISIEYLRDDKVNKTEAILGESKAGSSWITKSKDGEEVEIRIDMDDANFDYDIDLDDMKIEIDDNGDENIFYFRKSGEGKGETRPFLGIHMDLEDEDSEGVKLAGTTKDSGAEKAGLKKGDIIISIDGKAVNKLKDVTAVLTDKKTGDKVEIKYTRKGETQTTEAELGEKTSSKNMLFEIDEDHDFEFHGNKKVKRKVIVIKKKDDEGNEEEEKIIIDNDGGF